MIPMADNPFLNETDNDEYVSTYETAQLLGFSASSSVRDAFYSGRLDGIRFEKRAGRWFFHKGDAIAHRASQRGSTPADRRRLVKTRGDTNEK